MSVPTMRTAAGALEILKKEDPGTAVTLRQIRRMIVTGQIPCVPVGRKKLINMEHLYRCLEEGEVYRDF